MPFSNIASHVACIGEYFPKRIFIKRQVFEVVSRQKFPNLCSANPVRYFQSRRADTGHNTCPSGRAVRASCVELSKLHPLASQVINVGRFIKGATVAAQIGPTEVVHQNYYYIGLMTGSVTTSKKYNTNSNEPIVRKTEKFHKTSINLCLYVGLDTILGIRLC